MILSELPTSSKVELVSMKDTGISFLNYLDRIEMKIGTKIEILEIIEFDESVEIRIDNQKKLTVSKQVADNLLVIIE